MRHEANPSSLGTQVLFAQGICHICICSTSQDGVCLLFYVVLHFVLRSMPCSEWLSESKIRASYIPSRFSPHRLSLSTTQTACLLILPFSYETGLGSLLRGDSSFGVRQLWGFCLEFGLFRDLQPCFAVCCLKYGEMGDNEFSTSERSQLQSHFQSRDEQCFLSGRKAFDLVTRAFLFPSLLLNVKTRDRLLGTWRYWRYDEEKVIFVDRERLWRRAGAHNNGS